MPTLGEKVSKRARALSPEDRVFLAESVLEPPRDEPELVAEAAWDREIARRLKQVKAGTTRLFSAEDVHAEARRIYG